MLTHKYSPKSLKEIYGQNLALEKLKYNVQHKIPTILHGSTGTGKTSSVYALANELNFEVMELNASNFRNKDQIESIVGAASQQQSLFKKGKIILLDELDGISGTKDRGGLQALIKLLPKIRTSLVLVSKDISDKENIKYLEEDLKKLARSSNGDFRAALTDLQISLENNGLKVDLLSERNKTTEIFNSLKLIFKTLDPKIALSSLDNLKENLDEVALWLEENLPKEYHGQDLSKALDSLSKADVFKGRIIRQQYYRFMVYQIAFLTAGVALSKKEKNPGFVNYSRPSRILKMYIAKMRNSKKLAISKTLAEKTHTSTKRVMQNFGYYKRFLLNKDIISELELNEDEIKFLRS